MEESSLTTDASIDRLPDDVIYHILSFLPIKDALSNCILSRRWKCICTSITDLCFDDSLFPQRDSARAKLHLMNFVGRARNPRLDKCRVNKCVIKCVHDQDSSLVSTCIYIAMSRNVAEIDLHLSGSFGKMCRAFSFSFYLKYEKLSILKLHGRITLPLYTDQMSLPNLKVCHFKSIELLPNDFLEKLLSDCPILEELVIHILGQHYLMTDSLQIHSSSLKYLLLHRVDRPYYAVKACSWETLVIDTPVLEVLDLKDYLVDEFEVSMFPLLVRATIDVKKPYKSVKTAYEYAFAVHQLVRQTLKAKDLCLSSNTIKVLSVSALIELPTYSNLVHLNVRGGAIETKMLPRLRNSPPVLKVIIFDKLSNGILHMEDYATGHDLSSLKIIEFLKFTASPSDMEIIEFVMKNAISLKRVIIDVSNTDVHALGSNKLQSIGQDILKFGRGSKDRQVIFV